MAEIIPAPRGSAAAKFERLLRDLALAYPEAHEDRPWGERAIKVRRKTFVFMYSSSDGLHLSVKLPDSNREALLLPFSKPTGYGLGKSGWVSAHFGVNEVPPMSVLTEWVAESFRAVAPKTLAKKVSEVGRTPVATSKTARKKA